MAAKTRAGLNTTAGTDLADNAAGDISAADVRGMCEDLADSMVIWVAAPVTFNAAGEDGQMAVGADYIYAYKTSRWYRVGRVDVTEF